MIFIQRRKTSNFRFLGCGGENSIRPPGVEGNIFFFYIMITQYVVSVQTSKDIIFVREPGFGSGNVRTIYLDKFAE